MDRQKLIDRIAQLKQQREQMIAEANRAIGEYNGRIAELELMLTEEEKPIEEKST